MDDDDKTGVLGCLAGLVAMALGVGGVVFLANMDWSSLNADSASSASSETSSTSSRSTPLTRVGPVSEKQVVEKAAKIDPLARKIRADDEPPPTPPEQINGIVSMVDNLGMVAPPPQTLPPVAEIAVRQALAAESLCYKGKVARRVRSLFNTQGFAVTYGSESYNDGDPLPRLEFFYDFSRQPVAVTALSLTHADIAEFPNNHEIPVDYSSDAISKVIAKWTAAVATETCRR